MLIGITYDLKDDYLKSGYTKDEVAEFDTIDTIEGIENALKELGHKTDRIGNFKSLISRLNSGDRWDMTFNIAEGMHGVAREALIPAMLEAHKIPATFASAATLSLCLDKVMTKRVIQSFGFKTADFFEVKKESDIEKINLPYPLFAKPIAEGTSKGVTGLSKITNKEDLKKVCSSLLKQYNQSVLVETFLSGREFTVGIVGTGEKAKVVGNIEIIYGEKAEKGIYSYDNKANYIDRISYVYADDEIARGIEETALEIYRALDIRDAGRIDMRLDDNGVANFIEVNPLAGLNLTYSDLPIICYKQGMKYVDLIKEIIDSASERL